VILIGILSDIEGFNSDFFRINSDLVFNSNFEGFINDFEDY
jgi:hypothetical protein